jgi:microcin C transport system substrate-binding protein
MKKQYFLVIALFFMVGSLTLAADVIVSHALAMRGEPKYPTGFRHFDYVNPNAPKGGTLTQYTLGTYDSFNRYAQRGDPAVASDAFNDSLLVGSDDEIDVSYGLIAEKVEYDSDYRWIIFHLNPRARHQDGRPITAEDVVFSFYKFVDEGVPQFKSYFSLVEQVEALDRRRAKFTLSESDKETMVSLGDLTVLPKHYWESRNLSEPLTEIPVGSGAYTVSDHRMGQYIIYERMQDYWAMDLPVNRGRLNFDFVRYDYYRDQTVAFEAFKAGEYDIRVENEAKKWATQYTGSGIDAGYIVKEESFSGPPGANGPEPPDGFRVDEPQYLLRPIHPNPQLLSKHRIRRRRSAAPGGVKDLRTDPQQDSRRGINQGVQSTGHRWVGQYPNPGAAGLEAAAGGWLGGTG